MSKIYEVKEIYSDSEGVHRYFDSANKANERVEFMMDYFQNTLHILNGKECNKYGVSNPIRYFNKEKLEYPLINTIMINYLSDKGSLSFVALQVSELELE
ncbi:MAG: hypothetical protein ACQEXX_01070 [Bacillota bacterium]